MSLKDQLGTKVFTKEGTDQDRKGEVLPMKPDNILPIWQLLVAALSAVICLIPIVINIINQAKH